jgi:hypothetical protein
MPVPVTSVPADARPDAARRRVQLLFAARGGALDELGPALGAEAELAAAQLDAAVGVQVLIEIPGDVFPAANPLCRPMDAVVEFDGPAAAMTSDDVAAAVDGIAERLDPLVHVDLSGVLVGRPQRIIPGPVTALRYLYLMRRRAGTSHDAYLDYYFHHHSRFGFATPGIAAYTQFHVEPAVSRRMAARLGLGVHGIDSVSELSFDSVEAFFAGLGDNALGAEAGADEATFVDRDNSVSFCTQVRIVRTGSAELDQLEGHATGDHLDE